MNKPPLKSIVLLVGAPALAGLASDGHAQCSYQVAAIIEGPECPPLPPALVVGWSLNDHGDIAGDVNCLFEDDESFVWYGGPLITLSMPAGATESRACRVGDDGYIVGYVAIQDDGLGRVGFVYDGNDTHLLGVLDGHTSSGATARNSSNQVVGWSGNTITGPSPLAVIWDGGSLVDLTPRLETPLSRANDINDQGQIVGWRGTASHTDGRAFMLDLGDEHVTDIGVVPGGVTGEAIAVNSCGDVAATGLLTPNGPVRSFLWSHGRSTDLGLLPETTECVVWDLNDASVAVGQCSIDGSQAVAFVWKNDSIKNINELIPESASVEIRLATSINDDGDILGLGSIDGNNNVAVLLKPAEPRIADVDGDCRVNVADLLLVLSQWGPCEGCPADVNGDGVVDFSDLLIVLGDWG